MSEYKGQICGDGAIRLADRETSNRTTAELFCSDPLWSPRIFQKYNSYEIFGRELAKKLFNKSGFVNKSEDALYKLV